MEGLRVSMCVSNFVAIGQIVAEIYSRPKIGVLPEKGEAAVPI